MFQRIFALFALLALPAAALAHPMGNFSINHYSKIEIGRDAVRLRHIIDMAEIPTYQELSEIDADGDKNKSAEEQNAYAARKAEGFLKNLSLELNGKTVQAAVESSNMEFIPGAGGLPTIKITVEYRFAFDKSATSDINSLYFGDNSYPTRAGWKEVIVQASDGVSILESSAPSKDLSEELTSYPTDALAAPPQDVSASVSFGFGSASGYSETKPLEQSRRTNSANTPRDAFTELLSGRELSFGVILISLATAFALGAFHALSPGHGKTVVAAYLVGSRGTASHAFFLGGIVTLSHTAGVFLIGIITLYASRYILPEKLYPWLGFASGLMIAAIGGVLLVKRFVNLRGGDSHSHHGHDHHHGEGHHHDHEHGGHSHSHEIPEKLNFASLVALGVSGGIVPCPSALVVLLGAISLQKVGFGLVLIVAFSLGLASVLIAIGLLMVYARRFMDGFSGEGILMRLLPVASSFIITVLGFVIAVQSLVTGGVIRINP